MKDIPISVAQAAKWLNCREENVQALLQDGKIAAYAGKEPVKDALSLNSVIILAERLPVDHRIFHIQEGWSEPSGDEARSPLRRPDGPRGDFAARPTQRPPVVVERRPARRFSPV